MNILHRILAKCNAPNVPDLTALYSFTPS